MSALVVDDEAPALDELTFLLHAMPEIALVHAARNPSDAFRRIQERRYDIVFLDVRMPALNGIEFGGILHRFADPPAIVIVTAFEEYAFRAFEIGVQDYLLKPVSRGRLRTALGRVTAGPPSGRGSPPDYDSLASIPVETAGRTRFIPRAQVLWAEAEGDYVRLRMADGNTHLVRMAMSHLEGKWSAHGFIRIHRGYLVALAHITEFSVAGATHAVTVAGRSLPVSRRHARDVRDRILRAGRRG
ncbi:MAG TPA: LytTR family DNA-binding domain-containing protein [Streptosporangiaceae bacterium]|nr:LytTR family DNA-binding domain-containing protein [Streptosporangiaceae bacterium]